MKSTVHTPTAHSGGGLLDAVAAAAIAFGVGYLAVTSASSTQEECAEMDTTERLLSGGNRSRVLAALAQFEKGQFNKKSLIEGSV